MINNTMYLTGGKSPNPLSPPTNLAAKAGNAQVTLTWTDPPNATSEPSGQTIATWAYTQIVRKQGSQPTGPGDGTLVVKSSVRDQYQTTGYIDTNLTNDTLYYYGAFAYNSDGVYSEGAFVSATPQAGTPIGELTEGTLITINESGAPVEFYVAKQNYEAGLNGDGRTLMVRKNCYNRRQWNSSNINTWANSTMLSWLNSEYKGLFSDGVQSMLGSTIYQYTPGYGNNAVTTRSDAVFLPSMTELGQRLSGNWFNTEGSPLPIANTIKIAYLNGAAITQWSRSPYTPNMGNAMCVYQDGTIGGLNCSDTAASRPVFTLPATALIDSSNALIES